MQYMALIYSDESRRDQVSPAEQEQLLADYREFSRELKDSGAFIAGDALQRIETSTTIRVRDGQVLTTDGPFAETKEQLGGYYLMECKDLDEALRWAAKIPTAKYGSIEVRPLVVWS